jgi:short-subunit dehydrogenase involved in D-alanine esterification of teichoic acids
MKLRRHAVLALLGAACGAGAELPERFWQSQQTVRIAGSGPTALVARQRAMAQGLRTCWQQMASALGIARVPNDAQLHTMVMMMMLSDEQSGPRAYAAVLTVQFDMDAVERFTGGRILR